MSIFSVVLMRRTISVFDNSTSTPLAFARTTVTESSRDFDHFIYEGFHCRIRQEHGLHELLQSSRVQTVCP